MLDDMQFERYHTHVELDLFTQIYDAANNIQPVDAVEVVRCKDCKYWDTTWEPTNSDGYYCSMIDLISDDDFYCAHGERKTDE